MKDSFNQWWITPSEVKRILKEENYDYEHFAYKDLPTLLTFQEVKQMLRVSTGTLRKYVQLGMIAGSKLPSGEWRFHKKEIKRFLQAETIHPL